MCGIAGYFGNQDLVTNKKDLNDLMNTMKYRGPDGNGSFKIKTCKNFLGLFHCRLSIIDPNERSNQPLKDDNGVIIFNGMIYNYVEIKKKLISEGIKFYTNSDTEVLLKFLNIYGPERLDLLDGMWSFAYYNFKKKKFIISRDRFAEKPLYLVKTKKSKIFGSSIDYILKITKKKFKLSKKYFQSFLKNGFRSLYNPESRGTFFTEINLFEPGKYLEVDDKFRFKLKNYWQSRGIEVNPQLNFYNEAKNLNKTFKQIIKERTRSDFPIAAMLSGGIDSNAIASHIAKLKLNKKIHYFMAHSTDPRYDEYKLAKKTIKKYSLKCTFVKVKKSNKKNIKIINDIINKTGNLDPTVSWLLYSYICNAAKQKKFKVILSGTGGDEMFGGYYSHHLHYLLSIKNNKDLFHKQYNEWAYFIKPFIRTKELKDFYGYKKNYKKFDPSHYEYISIQKYFNKYKYEKKIKKIFYKNYFKNELYKEIFFFSLPPQISITDSVSMFHGLEARCPILSKKIFNHSFSYPNQFLIRNGFSKSILRESLHGQVPHDILNNYEKTGFYKNIDEFFNFNDKNLQNLIFENKFINSLIKKNIVKKLLTSKNKTNQESHLIFGIINSVLYIRKYKEYF